MESFLDTMQSETFGMTRTCIEVISLLRGLYCLKSVFLLNRQRSVKETKEGSDSVACSQLISCCKPKCVGMQFLVVGLIFQFLGIYLAIVWLVSR